MKIGIICGSHRRDSQSLKVSKFIEGQAAQLFSGVETVLVSLAGNPLPLWDESFWAADPKWEKPWKPTSDLLKSCDAFIVVSPEWGGMVPAGLKNLFLFCSNQEMSHKPGLIVTVSSGTGGAYPVAELRMSSYKNTQLCYIPEHIIVRRAEHLLNTTSPTDPDDIYVQKRMVHALKLLEQYAKALRLVRESGVADYKHYGFGM